jgi:tetratricopeptide (TPR) repeat protein
MGLPFVNAAARSNLGLALARQGALEEAERVERLAVEAFAAQGNLRMEGASRIYLAEIQLLAGRVENAARTARAAVDVLSTTPPARCHALAALARAELQAGALLPALDHARAAYDLLEALSSIDEGESLVRLVHAEALAASGDRAGARAAIAKARRRLLEKAARVADPRWRELLLHGVPENARTLALAEAWESSG